MESCRRVPLCKPARASSVKHRRRLRLGACGLWYSASVALVVTDSREPYGGATDGAAGEKNQHRCRCRRGPGRTWVFRRLDWCCGVEREKEREASRARPAAAGAAGAWEGLRAMIGAGSVPSGWFGASGLPPGMKFVRRTILTGASQQTLVIADGLDGETDLGYTVKGLVVEGGSAGNPEIYLRPNGITANQRRQYLQGNVGVVAANEGATLGMAIGSVGNGLVMHFNVDFFAKSGFRRGTNAQSQQETSATSTALNQFAGMWIDTTTPVSSLVIAAEFALGLGAGSEFVVFKWV